MSKISQYEEAYQELINYAANHTDTLPTELPPEFEIYTSKKHNRIYFRRCFKKCIWNDSTYEKDDSIWPEDLYYYLLQFPYNPYLVHIKWPRLT